MPSPSWEAVTDSESSASSRETPEELQVEQHLVKTFIGRITLLFAKTFGTFPREYSSLGL
jgi:hypothetical protein